MEPTVLIVDDIEMMRRELRRIVEEDGMKVIGEAATGRQGLEQYQHLQPQVVLMDINMPEMDGLEALKAIMKIDGKARIIMCSSLHQQRYILRAIRNGACDFVVKPFREDRITGAIRKALQDTGVD